MSCVVEIRYGHHDGFILLDCCDEMVGETPKIK